MKRRRLIVSMAAWYVSACEFARLADSARHCSRNVSPCDPPDRLEYVGEPEGYWSLSTRSAAAQNRRRTGADIYIVGKESVQGYMTMAGECAQAGALRAK